MATGVQIKEFDGGRGVEFEKSGDYIIMETGYHAFAFDAALLWHAMKKLFAEKLGNTVP